MRFAITQQRSVGRGRPGIVRDANYHLGTAASIARTQGALTFSRLSLPVWAPPIGVEERSSVEANGDGPTMVEHSTRGAPQPIPASSASPCNKGPFPAGTCVAQRQSTCTLQCMCKSIDLTMLNSNQPHSWRFLAIDCDASGDFTALAGNTGLGHFLTERTVALVALVHDQSIIGGMDVLLASEVGQLIDSSDRLFRTAHAAGLVASTVPYFEPRATHRSFRLGELSQLVAVFAIATSAFLTEKPLGGDLVSAGLPGYKLRRAIGILEERLDEQVSLQELANAVELSRFHFCRMFHRSTGATPHQWLLQRRIERARDLIQRDAARLTDIAYELGFSSQAHFTTVFRKLTGCSPKRWKQQQMRLLQEPVPIAA